MTGYRRLGLCPSGDADYCDDPDFQIDKDSVTKLLETWKRGRKQLDLFWKIWKGEYLLSMREKFLLIHKQPRTSYSGEPKEGDTVIVKDDKLPRSSWKLGKILKLIRSQDLKVRVAQIQLPGHSTKTRAINYLFPLELKEVSPQLQLYKASQDGLNEELCLITFSSSSWECYGVQAGLYNYIVFINKL